jgi:peptidoglycan-associated lipoprotein
MGWIWVCFMVRKGLAAALMGLAFVACSSKTKDIDTVSVIAPGTVEDFAQNVSNTVYFGFDKYELTPASEEVLKAVAAWFNTYPSKSMTIEGHADKRGTQDYNLALGNRRANSVKSFLVKSGVDDSRISTISYGKERLIALGEDEESHAQNRRSHVIIR